MRARVALLGPLVLAALVVVPPGAQAADAVCQGHPATVTGSAATLTGTEGDDVIVASATTYVVRGLGGNDVICAFSSDSSDSVVDAGDGDDTVVMTGRPDGGYSLRTTAVSLGAGDDTYVGWEGAEQVDVAPAARLGADTITTGAGTDVVGSGAPGEPDRDRIDLGDGQDYLDLALPAGSTVTADTGAGTDRLTLDDPGTGRWAVDLRGSASTVTHDGTDDLARVRGLEDLTARLPQAARLDVRGDGADNDVTLSPTPPRVHVDLRSGKDRLILDDVRDSTRGRVMLGGWRRDSVDLSSTEALEVALGEHRGPRRLTLADVHTLSASAPLLDVVGSPVADTITATGCEVDVHARGGADEVSGAPSGPYDGYACRGAAPQTGQVPVTTSLTGARLSGGTGDDVLVGTALADVLLGGPGHDLARGRSGQDRCRAEVVRSC